MSSPTKSKFAGLRAARQAEPEYPAAQAETTPASTATEPAKAVRAEHSPLVELPTSTVPAETRRPDHSSAKVAFSTYGTVADLERFAALCADTGKSRVRLFSEALQLLFAHYKV